MRQARSEREIAAYAVPTKRIHSDQDVSLFKHSQAYHKITTFMQALSDAVIGVQITQHKASRMSSIAVIEELLSTCNTWIDQCPPKQGPRRFGNTAFRDWHQLLEQEVQSLLHKFASYVPAESVIELLPYFTGSFGSSERLDYGTGHELSFIAFCGALFELKMFQEDDQRALQDIALIIFPRYLRLIQRLITTYTLEPAGSHGVWGLDDHFAIPYLLGAAQLSPNDPTTHPLSASITNKKDVEEFAPDNLYFRAIKFINDVKTGPFWEHSPMLYDISGIPDWQKISRGMRKMYSVEVLGKFPVVQHFLFGPILFPFEAQLDLIKNEARDSEVITEAVTELQAVQTKTADLRSATLAQERQVLDADTPLPEELVSHHKSQPVASRLKEQHEGAGQSAKDKSSHSGPEEEFANVEGLIPGIGIGGMQGTKAPFASNARTIHPRVLESEMKRRQGSAS